MGVEWSVADTSDPASVRAAVTPKTKVIWVETPSNPLLGITDIAVVAQIARDAGARLVVDNTFATPTSSSRSRSARTSSCTRSPSTWAVTRTSSAAR